MYWFLAYYINMENDAEVTKKIYFVGQFFDSEKACYLYAMSKAYDMIEKNEMFSSLELLAC